MSLRHGPVGFFAMANKVFCHGPIWYFVKFLFNRVLCLQNDGPKNRPVLSVQLSDRWFRRFVTGSMFKRFNRVNQTRLATGRWLNRLDRPIQSDF